MDDFYNFDGTDFTLTDDPFDDGDIEERMFNDAARKRGWSYAAVLGEPDSGSLYFEVYYPTGEKERRILLSVNHADNVLTNILFADIPAYLIFMKDYGFPTLNAASLMSVQKAIGVMMDGRDGIPCARRAHEREMKEYNKSRLPKAPPKAATP